MEQYCRPIDRDDVGLIIVLIKLLSATTDACAEAKLKLSVFNRRRWRQHRITNFAYKATGSSGGYSCSLRRRPPCAPAFVAC
jgi:hypothetical protein